MDDPKMTLNTETKTYHPESQISLFHSTGSHFQVTHNVKTKIVLNTKQYENDPEHHEVKSSAHGLYWYILGPIISPFHSMTSHFCVTGHFETNAQTTSKWPPLQMLKVPPYMYIFY